MLIGDKKNIQSPSYTVLYISLEFGLQEEWELWSLITRKKKMVKKIRILPPSQSVYLRINMNNEVWKGSSQERICEAVSAHHNPFVRPGTHKSGLQVCSFPWDTLCSHAAGEEPAAPLASVLPARWRCCHCFHYFYFRALCLLRCLVQAQEILSQRQNFLSRGIFNRKDF